MPFTLAPRSAATSTSLAWLALIGCALLAAGSARAAEFRVDGSYRIRFADNTDFALDDRPALLGQHTWVENRLRLTGKVIERQEAGGFEIQMSFDIFDGLLAGDTARDFQGLGWDGRSFKLSTDHTGFDFRALFAEFRLPFGQVSIGQMPSHWGLGMVANSGNDEDTVDFGDQRFGDIVERALFATKPLVALFGPRGIWNEIVMAGAVDLVYRDRLATLVKRTGDSTEWGDTAWQGIFAVIWTPDDATKVAAQATRRVQSFAHDQGNLHVWVFDATARTTLAFPANDLTLLLEGEGAAVNGRTSHATNLNALTSVAVQQQGWALRARLGWPQLEAELEAGYASGDSNPFDDASTGFSFNRDFKVGLVLWDEVMLFQSQNGAARLADPNLVGRPPNGADLLPTEGAVTNALYLKPTVRWRPVLLDGKVRFTGSLLWAHAPEPVVDPYQALLVSAPRNAYGAAAGQSYGLEIDAGVSYREKLFGKLALEVGAQYGVLFPGDVFAKPDGTTLGKVTAFKLRAGVQF